MKFIYFFLILLVPCVSFSQTTFKGKVIKIVDGDTFDLLLNGNTTERIRLSDIDCPEKGQDYGMKAKQALADYIAGQEVTVTYFKRDRNQRIIGTVFNGKVNINMIMVQEGWAWHFVKYSSDQRYAYAETTARKAKRGLWAQPNAIAPWDFRKLKRNKL